MTALGPRLVVTRAPYLQVLIAAMLTVAILEIELGTVAQQGLNILVAAWLFVLVRALDGGFKEALSVFALGVIPAVVSLLVPWSNLPVMATQALSLMWAGQSMLLTWITGRRLLRETNIMLDDMWGAVAIYILIGFAFANVYEVFWLADPAALLFQNIPRGDVVTFSDLLYFSFVTLGTLGYGDVAPVGQGVRLTAMFEALIGLMYIAMVLGRIVSMHTAGRLRQAQSRDEVGAGPVAQGD